MNKDEIMSIIPHREDMMLLDDLTIQGEYSIGHYLVKGNEFFLNGHFPDNPVVPGVILCEILAQSACGFFADKMNGRTLPLYTGMNNVKFRSPVRPGDLIETRCRIIRKKHPFYFFKGVASVKGKICASAEFSCAITGE